MNALLLAGLTAVAQTPDSISPTFPDPDRVFIDAAGIIRDGGVQSLADVLTSRVPGLLVVSGAGLNGGGSRIRFAGPRTIFGDGTPLILVDGIRVDAAADGSPLALGGPGPLRLDDFNVEDLESIEVISNPAVAMLHGPGALDGVILIRTKRGRTGPARLETYAEAWLETVSTRWPANYGGVDADNPNDFFQRSCALTFQAAGVCAQDYVQSFNPLADRSPFSAALRHHAGLNLTGGPAWGAFRLAGGFDGDRGVYDVPLVGNPDASSRWNLTAAGRLRPHAGVDLQFMVTRISSGLRLPTYGPISAALYGPSDSSGFSWTPLFDGVPRERLTRVTAASEAQVRIFRWLTGRARLGLDNVELDDRLVATGMRTEATRDFRNSTTAVSLSAMGPATDALRFRTTVVWERAKRKHEESARAGSDTGVFCQTFCSSSQSRFSRRWVGLYVAEDITIRERLSVTAGLRYDRFVFFDTNKYQYNPLVRVSWVARSGRSGLLSGLRLHATYGSGSGIGAPEDLGTPVFLPPGTSLEWPELRPERVTSTSTGVDAQLFEGRVNTRVTFYDLRSDAMHIVPLSTPFGSIPVFGSGARVDNQGIVAVATGSLLTRDDLRWDVQLSLWGNRNRLRAFDPNGLPFGWGDGQLPAVGYPVGGYWGYRVSYADANADGIIQLGEVVLPSYLERSWAGTPYPTQGAALRSSLRIGQRVRLAVALDYRAGHVLFNRSAYERCQRAVCRDRNDPATPLARQAVAVATSARIPLEYYEDADYLKLREFHVSFDLPRTTVGRLGAREATVSLAARNLFTWTRYSGGDPEAGSYGTATPRTPMAIADFGVVPVARSLALQVRISY